MKRKTINFVIIVLFTFFSVSLVYAETDYSKSIWNNNVVIGYELNHFSPIKTDSVKVSSTNKTNETEKINHGEFVVRSFAYAWAFYIACGSILIGLLLLGGIILIVFKFAIL